MKKIVLLLSLSTILFSCSKDNESPIPELEQPVNIYVVGGAQETINEVQRAVLWKNGAPTFLSAPNQSGYASSVFVNNNDVYVAGTVENANFNYIGTFWKNGISQNLNIDTTVDSACNSVYVYNNDVYVLGTNSGIVKYWKNGVENTATGIETTRPLQIVVNNNGIYILAKDNDLVKLWKDGVVTTLSDGVKDDKAKSLCVVNTDVYILAEEHYNGHNKIKYWKNGNVNYVPTTSENIFASSIAVMNNIIYVSGTDDNKAKVWANSVPTILSNESPVSFAWALTTFNGNTYSTGNTGSSHGVFKIWKNNIDTNITTTSLYSDPYFIFITN